MGSDEVMRVDYFGKIFADWSEFMGQPIVVRVNDGLAEAWVGSVQRSPPRRK